MNSITKTENSNPLENIRCIVCDNKTESRFTVKYQKKDCNIVECQSCGFTFIPPFYRRKIDYTNYKDDKVIKQLAKSDLWIKYQRNLLRYSLIGKYKKNGSIYDIGCGFGHFIYTGKKLGYDVSGLEMNKTSVDYMKREFNIDVDFGDFIKIEKSRKYDIVTMWDVLEHIDNADLVIKKIGDILKPDGIIVFQVPQYKSFFSTLLKGKWWAMGLDHVTYFTPKTAEKLLNKYGFHIIKRKSSIELKNVLLYVLLPKLKRRKKARAKWTSSDRQEEFNKITSKPYWLRKCLVKGHNIIYKTLSFLHIGDEMIVIAQSDKKVT